MTPQDMENLVRELQGQVASLHAQVAALQDPRGRIFLADVSNSGSTNRAMEEMVPTAAGTALQHLVDGRSVSGLTDPGVFLAIDGLGSGQRAFLGFQNGTNSVYVPTSDQLRYGKIQSIGDCNSYAVVKECNLAGTLLNDTLITVFPTLGSCDATSSGFCYEVGATISYMRSPDDPTGGIQVGAYKKTSIGYQCAEAEGGPTNLAHVDDLARIEPYLTDFFIGSSSTCGGTSHINLAQLNWRGFMVALPHTGGSTPSPSDYCGATNTAGTGGVKVLNFDTATGNTASIGDYAGTSGALIAFNVTCATTGANVPTLGGSPCFDNSLPKMATIKGFFPVGITIDASDPSAITAVQNEDCSITFTFPTMRCVVPFP